MKVVIEARDFNRYSLSVCVLSLPGKNRSASNPPALPRNFGWGFAARSKRKNPECNTTSTPPSFLSSSQIFNGKVTLCAGLTTRRVIVPTSRRTMPDSSMASRIWRAAGAVPGRSPFECFGSYGTVVNPRRSVGTRKSGTFSGETTKTLTRPYLPIKRPASR